ncbi:MAG TPA: hypothetical protein VFC46_05700 [Humisphaera sp.]|nr:hypothetical protein [Humisphaera sp.]
MKRLTSDYFELTSRFPLIPIEDQKHFAEAMVLIDELGIIDEEKLTKGQAKYLMVLTDLVERYERSTFPLKSPFKDGIDVLKYLLEEAGMSASDLGRILGNRQLGAAILRRDRELSKTHIVQLANYFKVSTDLFFWSRGSLQKAS